METTVLYLISQKLAYVYITLIKILKWELSISNKYILKWFSVWMILFSAVDGCFCFLTVLLHLPYLGDTEENQQMDSFLVTSTLWFLLNDQDVSPWET